MPLLVVGFWYHVFFFYILAIVLVFRRRKKSTISRIKAELTRTYEKLDERASLQGCFTAYKRSTTRFRFQKEKIVASKYLDVKDYFEIQKFYTTVARRNRDAGEISKQEISKQALQDVNAYCKKLSEECLQHIYWQKYM